MSIVCIGFFLSDKKVIWNGKNKIHYSWWCKAGFMIFLFFFLYKKLTLFDFTSFILQGRTIDGKENCTAEGYRLQFLRVRSTHGRCCAKLGRRLVGPGFRCQTPERTYQVWRKVFCFFFINSKGFFFFCLIWIKLIKLLW